MFVRVRCLRHVLPEYFRLLPEYFRLLPERLFRSEEEVLPDSTVDRIRYRQRYRFHIRPLHYLCLAEWQRIYYFRLLLG